jgi:FKBP-type peptidyl-prolyl cis-trans isomerase
MKWYLIALAALFLAGCERDPFGPAHVTCDNFLLQFGVATGDTIETPEGLRYIDIRTGSGDTASPGRIAEVNYTGYLLDGTVFDTSCPSNRAVLWAIVGGSDLIAGFDLGMMGMRPGGVRRLIIPPELGYGSNDVGIIPANSTLIFDVQLIGFARL